MAVVRPPAENTVWPLIDFLVDIVQSMKGLFPTGGENLKTEFFLNGSHDPFGHH
jgi:hypothetical protein